MHIHSVTFKEQTILEYFFKKIIRKGLRVTQYNEQIIEIVF